MNSEKDPVQIRLAEQGDGVYLTSWLLEPGVLRWFPMNDPREVEDSVRLWMSYAQQGTALTAVQNGVPCGMANLYIQPFKKLSHQCLFAIIIGEKYRGKGIGKTLLQALMKHAKEKFKIEVLHLEVYEENPARHLYEKMGFQKYGEQKRFLKEEENVYRGKILMQKEL